MRVVVIDDDAIVCRSLETILGAQDDIEVVGLGTDGADAVRLFGETQPDVLLMDIQMPGMGGLTAAEQILGENANARIVFLTTFSDNEYVVRALRMGARGYLIKQDVATIAPALRAVMAGQCVLEGEVLGRAWLAGGPAAGAAVSAAGATGGGPKRSVADKDDGLAGLTEREREVVQGVADGLDNAEIATQLCMSPGTVRNHISSILAKLDLRNRTQIAVHYYRHK